MSCNVKVFFIVLAVTSPSLDSEIKGCDWKALLNLLAFARPLVTPRWTSESRECRPLSLIEFGDFSNVCREARHPIQNGERDGGWEKEMWGLPIGNEWIDLTMARMTS